MNESPYVTSQVTQRSISESQAETMRSLLRRFLHDHDADPDLSVHSADLIKQTRAVVET